MQRLIEENYRTLKYPKQYADLMNISVKHLNRISAETVGKTTGSLIAERLILEAKRMLAYTALPVKDVAEQLGFDDTSYFTRFFRKQTGQTPLAFQKSIG